MVLRKQNKILNEFTGQQQVQGLDYAYTLEGWLKGVNSISLQPANDMGNDGLAGSANQFVARDAYGFNLNYFTGEYAAINSGVLPFPGHSGYMSSTDYKPLYNGNISSMAVNIGQLNQPLLYNYQYDQLNRIVSMDAFNGLNQTGNNWTGLNKINDYQERASYDANGNIQTYLRNGTTTGGAPLAMDNLTYNYNKDANGQLTNNKLTSVNDAVAAGNYPDDIDNQSANNYSYDAIGNLTQDVAGGINTITWTVYGKISSIAKADGSMIAYTYDASGNRISKTVTPASGTATTTWYVRDASGNVMAVYTVTGSSVLTQSEQHLYGSSRLGIYNRNINADATLPGGTNANLIGKYFTSDFTRGNKVYELSNHLGNVLVTVSDKKIGVDANGDGVIDYYTADVVTANDYYPFGSLMPGRKYSIANTNYRYGFNGKENDNEVKGEGNQLDFEGRVYDPRIGIWLSTDPKTSKYPGFSPYIYSANNPITFIDPDGEDWIVSTTTNKKTGITTINITVNAKIVNNSSKPIDMQKLIKNVKANLERLYSGSDASKKLNWKMTVNLEEFKSDKNNQSNLRKSDHFIEIQDDNKFQPNVGGYSHQGGLYIGINAKNFDASGSIGAIPQGGGMVTYNTSIIAHELGHTGGLYHPWDVANDTRTVNGGILISPGQIDVDKSDNSLYYTFMGYATKPPAGEGDAGKIASENPNPATVGQITDIKLNAEKGNLNGNDTTTPSGKVIQKRTEKKAKE